MDELAFWEDSAGIEVDQPADADNEWRLGHRWVWNRARIVEAITGGGGIVFLCGIARNQCEMLHLFDKVFLLMVDDATQIGRLARSSQTTSPDRTDTMKQQIRAGRPVFQAEMLACGAVPLDGTAPTQVVADTLLDHLGLD